MSLRFETSSDIESVDQQAWNQLALEASPMMEWEYFYCMEKSGSVSKQKGYRPRHLMAYDGNRLVAIAPLYERDRAWVEFGDGGLIEFLTEMTGFPYHQGLVGTLPFTPIPAYRFLIHPQVDASEVYGGILNYIDYMCHSRGLSTSRIYFLDLAPYHLHTSLLQQGYICIRSEHYLWKNHNYKQFGDFLKSLKSNRRTKIRRELRDIRQKGIEIQMIPGMEASSTYYEVMFEVYLRTWTKYMGPHVRAFLNEDFFRLLGQKFPHRISFSLAHRAKEIAGMALFYMKSGRLYGRYWGSFEQIPFLHFATCYYYPIEYAIQNGFRIVDPGFGGEHKLYRGFEIVPVFHYIKFYGNRRRRVAYSILEQMKTRSPSFLSLKGRV
jgi:predicted N-acyltransferase